MKYKPRQLQIQQIRQELSGKWGETKSTILNTLVTMANNCPLVYPSQRFLAEKAHCKNRKTGMRATHRLRDLNVITKVRRFNDTCVYHLTSEFINLRHLFRDLTPALWQTGLLMLFSISSNILTENVPLINNNNYSKRSTSAERVIVPPFGNGWCVVTIKNGSTDFYDPDYGAHEPYTTFIYKQTTKQNTATTTSNSVLPLKESVMSNKSVINLIADAYGLSVQQEQMLEVYSEQALKYALAELSRQNREKRINNPVNWIAKVAASFSRKQPTNSYNGKGDGRLLEQPTLNPGGHSPMAESSHLSNEDRIAYAVEQESIWEEIVEFGEGMESAGFHTGYPDRVRSNWKRIGTMPQEFPLSSDSFKDIEPTNMDMDPEYIEHLDEISRDKSNPAGYKELVSKYDQRRVSRRK